MGKKKKSKVKIPIERNKFLDDLGLSPKGPHPYGVNLDPPTTDPKSLRIWQKQKQKWGFDERICWNLDSRLIEYIYTWCCIYEETATIVDMKRDLCMVYGEVTTLKKALKKCKKMAKRLLLTDDMDRYDLDDERDPVRELFHYFAEIAPYLWW